MSTSIILNRSNFLEKIDDFYSDDVRDVSYWHIYRKLLENKATPNKLSSSLETAIYNCTIEKAIVEEVERTWENPMFTFIYLAFLNKVLVWLDISENIQIIYKYIDNSEEMENIVKKSTYEFNPQETSKIQSIINYRQKVDKVRKITNEVCRKCDKKEVEMDEQQRRSCDEAATFRFRCLNCGHIWE